MNHTTVNISTESITSKMSIEEITRWCCLIESIQVADSTMKAKGINPEHYDWVKPIAIEKYIDERYHSMKHDVMHEMKHGDTRKPADAFFE